MSTFRHTCARLVLCGLITLCVVGTALSAVAYDFSATGLVDHPVSAPLEGRSPTVWRHGVGQWGEGVGEQTLRLRGFNEIYEVKNGSNNGIDRIALKRAPNGRLLDFRIVEIKTSRTDLPKLNRTRAGIQMDRYYLASKFRAMRKSGNPEVRKLATELSRFRRSSGRSLSSFGEVLHVRPTSNTIVGYATDGRTVKYKYSLKQTLQKLQTRSSSAATRQWATRQLVTLERIRSADMRTWTRSVGLVYRPSSPWHFPWKRRLPGPLDQPWPSRGPWRYPRTIPVANVSRESAAILATSVQRRAQRSLLSSSARRAGPLIVVAATALDVYNTERAFALDRISVRERHASHARTGGGLAGGVAGGTAGAAGGAAIGAFTGPFAPICVPLFGIVGGIGGSVGGYIGGATAADYGVKSWYRLEDKETQQAFRERFVSMRFPLD